MVEIKLSFASVAEAAAFLAAQVPPTVPKSVQKTEAAAPTPPSAPPVAAPETPKIEYAPLGEKITRLVAAGKASAVKDLLVTLKPIDGVEVVKKGSQVHADDLGALKAGLEALEAAVAADTMS